MTSTRFQRLSLGARRSALTTSLLLALIDDSFTPRVCAADDHVEHTERVEHAEQLFAQGKERLAQNDFDRACPLLAASYETDPALGSLLALAVCHERAGKLASAFREYAQVAQLAAADEQTDRAQAAQERSAALAPELSTLSIQLRDDMQAIHVWLDGQEVDRTLLCTLLPVDGGSHRVEALLPGDQRFSTEVEVANSSDAKTVQVAASETTLRPQQQLDVHPSTARLAPSSASGLTHGQYAGLATMAAGVLSLGTAGVLAIVATNNNEASQTNCNADLCTERGRDQRFAARRAGDAASVAILAAGAFATVGVALFFTERRPKERTGYAASVWAVPHAAGAELHGAF